jgi:hypothetical protein
LGKGRKAQRCLTSASCRRCDREGLESLIGERLRVPLGQPVRRTRPMRYRIPTPVVAGVVLPLHFQGLEAGQCIAQGIVRGLRLGAGASRSFKRRCWRASSPCAQSTAPRAFRYSLSLPAMWSIPTGLGLPDQHGGFLGMPCRPGYRQQQNPGGESICHHGWPPSETPSVRGAPSAGIAGRVCRAMRFSRCGWSRLICSLRLLIQVLSMFKKVRASISPCR